MSPVSDDYTIINKNKIDSVPSIGDWIVTPTPKTIVLFLLMKLKEFATQIKTGDN
jgi:hypothetical protein